MTREQILALEGRELRESVGRLVMGWTTVATVEFAAGRSTSSEVISWKDTRRMPVSLPHFERSLDAARLVEDEVERRGLHREYISHLGFVLEDDGEINMCKPEWSQMDVWAIRRATPTQIARAALLAALGGK